MKASKGSKAEAASQEEKVIFNKGDRIIFLGYSDAVPEEDRYLIAGEIYQVDSVNTPEQLLSITVKNPTFDPGKPSSKTNAQMLLIDCYFDEVELSRKTETVSPEVKTRTREAPKTIEAESHVVDEDDFDDEDEDVMEDETPPAPEKTPEVRVKSATKPDLNLSQEETKKSRGRPKGSTKPQTEVSTETVKSATASKTTIPSVPAGEKIVSVTKYDDEGIEILQAEDEDILAMVNEADDLLALAQELDEEGMSLDWKLSGVLYHVRLTKAYRKLDARYTQAGGGDQKSGFQLYLEEKLSVGYRKAMNLIQTYIAFNKCGVSGQTMGQIGWTKASKIAMVMNLKNVDALVEEAGKASVAQLSSFISENYKNVGEADKKKQVTFKFKLWEDQAAGVQEIIEKALQMLGSDDINAAFEHIVKEWAIAQEPQPPEETKQENQVTRRARPQAHVNQ